jgi:hypothetical protein
MLCFIQFHVREAPQGDDAEAEIAHFVEDSVEGRLIGQYAGQNGIATLVLDLQTFEPFRPGAVQDAFHSHLIAGWPPRAAHD